MSDRTWWVAAWFCLVGNVACVAFRPSAVCAINVVAAAFLAYRMGRARRG